VVGYQPEDGDPIRVTRIQANTSLDMAVLHLQKPAPAVMPATWQVTTGEGWRIENPAGYATVASCGTTSAGTGDPMPPEGSLMRIVSRIK
jgi:hypothetical protein